MKVLNVVECAYGGDPVLAFVHTLGTKAGGNMAVLLRGNAVNYLNKRQHADRLRLGDYETARPPNACDDLDALTKAGIAVYYVEDDAGERGLERPELLGSARPVARNTLANFFGQFDRIFHF